MFHKRKKSMRLVPALLCLSMTVSLCTACGIGDSKIIPQDNDNFDTWVNDYFVNYITDDTLTLHYTYEDPAAQGITDYPVTLGECSQEASDEFSEECASLLNELKGFDYDNLSGEQQQIYDLLADRLEVEAEAEKYPYYEEPLSPMIGMQTELPSLLSEYNLNTKQDVEDYLELLADVDRYFGEMLVYEQEKSEAGLFMSDEILDMTISDIDSFIKDASDSYLIDTFRERIANVPELSQKETDAYCERNDALVTGEIVEAYQDLKSGLEALRGTGKNEGGLGNFKKGRKYYQYLVRSEVGTDLSVAKLEKMTDRQIEDDFSVYYELYEEDSSLPDKVDNFSFTLTDPEEILADLQEKMLKDFPALNVSVDLHLKEVSESLEESTSPAYYLTAAMDNLKDDVIYINYGYSDKTELYSTLAHEGYPGHLYQIVYSGALEQNTPVRRILETSGYCEGWATYVENLSYSYDDSRDTALLTAMQVNSSASLGIYAMADYYINYEGCSKKEIKKWSSDYFSFSDSEFDEFYYTILSQPANYLNYYVGYLEFVNLKEEAEEALGDDFDLKEFHTFLLDNGNAPFYILEDWMQDWLAEVQKAA